MRTVLPWIDLFERDDVRSILKASGDPESRYALENLESLWKTDHRYQGSVIGTLSTALDAWQEPTVIKYHRLFDLNPFTHLAVTYQEILFFPGPVGHAKWLLALGAGSVVLFVACYWFFDRLRDSFAEAV